MKTGGRIHSLLFALILGATPAIAADQSEPKYIVLSPEECEQVATEVGLSVYEMRSGAKGTRPGALTANAARVAALIVELNPQLASAEPGQVAAYLMDACAQAQGQTDVPEMVRN